MAKKVENLKPNFFAWCLYYLVGKLYLLTKYRYKINRREFKQRDKKKGCVIIYNHGCVDDHFLLTQVTGVTRVNYVITRRFLFNKTIRVLLRWVKAVTREQFKTDMGSILKMKRITERGGIISIAPAGQVTLDGEVPFIHDAIVKLCKMCKVDVYTIRIHGTYFANPKWGKVKHRYPLYMEIVKTLSTDELKNESNEYIFDKIYNSLKVVDRDENKDLIKIKSKERAKGLDDVLFICPKCKEKFTIKTYDDKIECVNCHNLVRYNEYGFLEKANDDSICFKDEHQWNEFQLNTLVEEFKNGKFIEDDVTLYSTPSKEEEFTLCVCGQGKLFMDVNTLKYIGTYRGQHLEKQFSTSALYQVPFAPGERFNIPDDEGFFEFVPKDPKRVIEWVESVEAIYKIKHMEE